MSQYIEPGVSVIEVPGPTIAAASIEPTVLAIVGDTRRYRVHSQVVQLNGTDPVPLSKLGINDSKVSVKDRYTGQTYVVTTDYVVNTSGNPVETTIARESNGDITDGTLVVVTYEYSAPDFADPLRFSNYDEVVDAYGPAFNSSGDLVSELTLAAWFAFQNNAPQIVGVAVDAAGSTPTVQEWQAALAKLANEDDVNVVIVATGETDVHDAVQNWTVAQELIGNYVRTFLGRDGSAGSVTWANLRSQASGYSDPRTVLVAPARVNHYLNEALGIVELGGQYLAAAVAGLFASQPVQLPLTNKTVRGFYNFPELPDKIETRRLSSNGVLTVVQRRDGRHKVQHGVTTYPGDLYKREISIMAARDRVQDLVLTSVEGQNLIGSVYTDETPVYVVGAVQGALEVAVGAGLITSYSGIRFRNPSSSPTTLEIRFQYLPALPLNRIEIAFSLDTRTGSTEFIDLTTAAA